MIRDFCFVGSESVEDLLPLGNADFLHNKVLSVSSHSTIEYMSLLKCNLSNYWKIVALCDYRYPTPTFQVQNYQDNSTCYKINDRNLTR